MGLKIKLTSQMVVKQLNMVNILWKSNLTQIDDLPLNKPLKFLTGTIVVISVLEEHGKFYN